MSREGGGISLYKQHEKGLGWGVGEGGIGENFSKVKWEEHLRGKMT